MYDVIIIGAGQAGLAMGYQLKNTKLSYLLLDKAEKLGETWRIRYDSLTLFTPRSLSSLPGLPLDGNERVYPTKDEIADYLENYANVHGLPIQLNTSIKKVSKINGEFKLETSKGDIFTRNVIIATGPFQNPAIPSFAGRLSQDVLQLHSSQYKNPSQLKDGPVLVVGGGNSGAQIAVELSKTKEVHLSISQKLTFLPQDTGGKSIFWWFEKLGILQANVKSKLGAFLKNRPDPIFGLELKEAIKNKKVLLKPRTSGIKNDRFVFENGSELEVSNVIWSTGFRSNYSWLDIPSILDAQGNPIHERGVTAINGLYFLGLPWQYRRGSALLQGVGYDAQYIAQYIQTKEG
ncbi:flavin-containing monooxygenase [Fredinandcohnia humi]